MVDQLISKSSHIHARIGFEEGPQVNDPSAPEWHDLVNIYVGWWKSIIQSQLNKGITSMTITPEFGPAPYMPMLAHSQVPVSDQWKVNLYMRDLLRERL
ncbi:hypothetical protein [Colwellia sp. E2M01]|uniref:hypothetical protein n=1 Tax=Colwellia sp. E2M01 TaxID=2841561 RepID=UPI001C0818D0|nr:hypothetical protein [Colwellia sp. E2M01]MBU2870735.1 hypothetical protein [Colwellia sp. E2M01]